MKYVTVSGDSFDWISFKVFGSCRQTPDLIAANPAHVETFIFSAGVELTIPEVETPKQSVLPWRN